MYIINTGTTVIQFQFIIWIKMVLVKISESHKILENLDCSYIGHLLINLVL